MTLCDLVCLHDTSKTCFPGKTVPGSRGAWAAQRTCVAGTKWEPEGPAASRTPHPPPAWPRSSASVHGVWGVCVCVGCGTGQGAHQRCADLRNQSPRLTPTRFLSREGYTHKLTSVPQIEAIPSQALSLKSQYVSRRGGAAALGSPVQRQTAEK